MSGLPKGRGMGGLLMGTGAMDRFEVFSWYTKMTEPTALEREMMDKIDPIELEIFFHKVMMIAYEGKETMVKVGVTPGMTGTDLNCAIYTASGDIAVSGMGVYVHALSGQGPIKFFKRYFGESVGIRDGDLLYVTDPYLGGTHVNDQFLVTPIFAKGELIAWIAAGCHQAEVGAVEVGMSGASKNRFGDGMNCTTIKIGENMTLRDDLAVALANMNRDPQSWILDLKARYAAIVHMRNELLKLCNEKGAKYVAGGLRRIITDTASAARKKVSNLNDGTYRGVIFMDTIGDRDALLRLAIAITVKGDKLYIDYTGTSPQVPGSMNAYNFVLPGGLVMYLMPYVFHDLPPSLGVLAPVEEYRSPGKTITDPDPDVSVSLGVWTLFAMGALTHQVWSKMIFDSPYRDVVAAPQGWAIDVMQSVVLNQRGLSNVGLFLDCNASGQGGRVSEDGTNSMNPIWAALADYIETEWIEKDTPYLFLFRKHAVDSGGAGKYRGGLGVESGWVAHGMPFGIMTTVGAGAKIPNAPGLFGGYASTIGPCVTVWDSGYEEMIKKGEKMPKSRADLIEKMKDKVSVTAKHIPLRQFHSGDILTSQNPGGGGYGDPLERDPALVIKDLREGAISHWAAENVYKVAYDKDKLLLDEKGTEELRKAERANRKKRGKSFEEFEEEWSSLRPPAKCLEFFGPWEIA